MSIKPARTGRRQLNADKRMQAALSGGLAANCDGIDSNPVHKKLALTSVPAYDAMFDFWEAYERINPRADPRNMQCMKHIAEAIVRSTPGRLDEGGMATVKTVRVKVWTFMSEWQQKTNLSIPKAVHDSMVPYVTDVLRYEIPLWIKEKEPTFLTIQNYLDMEELLWQRDHHKYIHEGCRVDELVCMVVWKDGEPDIIISFKREHSKGMADTFKKPKHPIYERLDPPPPLCANTLLFLLSIMISSGAFENHKTVEDVLSARAPKGRYQVLDWADDALDKPVFPEMSSDWPTEKIKNETSWGQQCSDWAVRADFTEGMGLHAARREALIQVDDGGYSLGQVMKYAGHRNAKTLVGHYLDDASNVDGTAAFLKTNPRRDLTEYFHSESMKKNPNLPHSLTANILDHLKQH
ncbi:hypothetical protein VC83_03638 [Pseudogymnoascus destructans]|uniref:Tyr recombinase domain-containing protein n=1 Tax=Pseudogymnoascus destructans TaxID=655981 RepID=A0A177AHI6_9PEZI|nr:uncharacterized protein VC83_03638 [Pseudogymnoascus destructans]OAF60703.1 hypothetical protein VC83_03638 [Pseudogymnoascus destructans]